MSIKPTGGARLFITALALALIIYLIFASAGYASGRDDVVANADASADAAASVSSVTEIGPSTSTQVMGDTGVQNQSYALGLSNGLGDVDIADCVVTDQWGTPLFSKQGFHYNVWCMANHFENNGLISQAANLYCQIKPILEEFKHEKDQAESVCVIRYGQLLRDKAVAAEISTTRKITDTKRFLDEHEAEAERHEQQLAMQQDILSIQEEEIVLLKAEIDQLKNRQTTVRYERQPLLSQSQRQKLQEVLNHDGKD